MSVDIRKLMQVDDKGTQRQYYPETNIEAINGLQDLLLSGDFPALEETIRQFESNVSETSGRLNRLKGEMTEMVEGEHGFLELEPGFENYNNGDRGDRSSQLQYFRIGNLVKIFGTVKNTGTIKAGSQVAIATLPYRLSVRMVDVVRAEEKNGTFRCRIYNFDNQNLGNQIVMSDTRNSKGESIDFKQGKWLNVSLTAGIEVI